jgi:hypothetical protein
MLYYPQLSTGTLAQYPLRKRLQTRTILNECLDSSTVKLAAPAASEIQWDLNYAALSEAEWNAIAALFQAAEGRLQTFVFADPTGNLMRWSETLSSTVWQKDGLVQLTPGVSDTAGAARATRIANSGQVVQGLSQAITTAGWFQYCFSVYARSSTATTVTLTRSTANGAQSQTETLGPEWRRIESSGQIDGSAEEIVFGLEIPASGIVDVFGFQVEAQPQASPYKATTNQGGVYPQTRFVDDFISPIVIGMNDYSVQAKLVSKAGD